MDIERLGIKNYSDLTKLKDTLRSDERVVGIWDNMSSDKGGHFYHHVTFQFKGDGSKLTQITIPREGGKYEVASGELVFKRSKEGPAKRVEAFVSETGEEMMLGIREF